jgi:threonine synthase
VRASALLSRLTWSVDGTELPLSFARPFTLHQGKPVVFEYDLARVAERGVLDAGARGILRWAALLPVADLPAGYADDVGGTAIVPCRVEADVDLHLQCEGTNPSGSFKDRGLSIGVALAKVCGARRVCLPTQGNAGVSAALFSARAGLEPALVYMPGSLGGSCYARAAEAFGAEVRFAGASIADAGRAMRAAVAGEIASGSLADVSTFFEPGRLEGKKTLGLEIAEHFGDAMPDAIVYPTGGGTGLVGIWKAFAELGALGRAFRLPRMFAVQASGCPPLVRAFEAGADDVTPVVSTGTVADGLDVPAAVMGQVMLRVLRESGGAAIAVEEGAIAEGQRRLARAGVSAGYEAGAALAAVSRLVAGGLVARGARVLVVVTSGAHAALAPPFPFP